jgi:hypothetical protein
MPRYFFHLNGSGVRDSAGQEFANDNAARQEAIAVAVELRRNVPPTTNEQLIVMNESGEVIFEQRIVAG